MDQIGININSSIRKSFFFSAILMFAMVSLSQATELTDGQKAFSNDLAVVQSKQAEQINKQAQKRERENIVVAQTVSEDKKEISDERIQELERKLESVTRELQEMKAEGTPDARMEVIEEKLNVLAEEIDNIKQASVVEDPIYESVYGAGPAASKVYFVDKGLSIGGYGELAITQIKEDADNVVDALRVVLYFGYKFTDRIIFNSELEFEHGTTGTNPEGQSGSVSVEFALLDFLLWPELNLRGGVLLAPFGIINEIHEPTTFFGVLRPAVERIIIPTTWRENGIGIFGDIDLQGAGTIGYRAYLMNSFDARGFDAADNRGLRINGNRALLNDVAFVSRVEYEPFPFVAFGGSIFLGNTGQDQVIENAESPFDGESLSAFFQMYEADVQFLYRGFEARALGVYTTLGGAARVNALNDFTGDESVGNEQWGYYVLGAYNVLSLAGYSSQYAQYLAPFVRWEQYDTQSSVPSGFERNPANDRSDLTLGLNYKPIPRVVVKAEYQWLDNEADSSDYQINFGLGYVF